jgi:hypothetical protein
VASAYAQIRTPWGHSEARATWPMPGPAPCRCPPSLASGEVLSRSGVYARGRSAPPGCSRPASPAGGRSGLSCAIAAAVLSATALRVIDGQPAAPAVVTGIITWFMLTGRGDLAPPARTVRTMPPAGTCAASQRATSDFSQIAMSSSSEPTLTLTFRKLRSSQGRSASESSTWSTAPRGCHVIHDALAKPCHRRVRALSDLLSAAHLQIADDDDLLDRSPFSCFIHAEPHGYKLAETGWLLPGFVAYLDAHGSPTVTIEAALAWTQQAPKSLTGLGLPDGV